MLECEIYPAGSVLIDPLKLISMEFSLNGSNAIILSEEFEDYLVLKTNPILVSYVKEVGNGFVQMNKGQWVRPDCFGEAARTRTGRILFFTKQPKKRFELFPWDDSKETLMDRLKIFADNAWDQGVNITGLLDV